MIYIIYVNIYSAKVVNIVYILFAHYYVI